MSTTTEMDKALDMLAAQRYKVLDTIREAVDQLYGDAIVLAIHGPEKYIEMVSKRQD